MKRILAAMAALAFTAAFAAEQQAPAPQPAASAPAAAGGDCPDTITTRVVNGKTVEVRKKGRCAKPQAVKLWD